MFLIATEKQNITKKPSPYSFFASSLDYCCYFCLSMLMVLILKLSSSLVNADTVYQPEAAYLPCTCNQYSTPLSEVDQYGIIALSCYGENLNDSRVSDILDAFITTPDVSPLTYLNLPSNNLTRVPTQIKSFDQILVVNLRSNAITSIQSSAFYLTDSYNSNPYTYPYFDLTSNQLTTIAPGAFTGFKRSNSYFAFLFIIES